MVNKINRICFGAAITGQALDLILESAGSNSLPPISNHIGDWTYISATGFMSGFVGNKLIGIGQRTGKEYLVKIGEKMPKIATVLATVYITLGETIMPKILPGTPDFYDAPAVLIAGILTYVSIDVITTLGRKEHEYTKHIMPQHNYIASSKKNIEEILGTTTNQNI